MRFKLDLWKGAFADQLQRPSYSADWGDYISFAQRMREQADEKGVDLLLVDTGDRIEGNGLYDASDPKGKYTREIFKQQHIDVICSGNHELYKQNSSENEYLKMVPEFKGNYLASNLDIFDPKTGEQVPLAPRYKKFTTRNQGIRVLAFGFLFDFTGNSNNTVVQPVERTIQEKWFQDTLRDREVDLFLVAGHVDIRSEEYQNIFKAIRQVQWDTPIQFFGGHSHIRDFKRFDNKAYALESGRYMETIGFQSIVGLKTGGKTAYNQARALTVEPYNMLASPTFSRRYIDNNLFSFHHHTSLNSTTFPTLHGQNVSSLISLARKSLNLDSQFGCAPKNLWTNRAPFPSGHSIFTWIQDRVLPDAARDDKRGDAPRITIVNTGTMRFDIFKGPFTIDTTFTVSPFASNFRYIKDVPFSIADRVLLLLNNEGQIFANAMSRLGFSSLPQPEQLTYPKKDVSFELKTAFQGSGRNQVPLSDEPPLVPGYTTRDDAGDDGDDTIHSPLSFYRVPNCIEARLGLPENPETVDLVYLDFIEQYILLATQFLGGEYTVDDTDTYMAGTDLTTMISDWVKENWTGDC